VYAGHFAAAVVLRAKEPQAPFWAILIGVGFLDLLFGPFVLLGIERATVTPDVSPGFSLDHIDWSHSLAMSVVWSVLFGALFLKRGRRVATVIAIAVFSHFLLDLPMHPPDLALWPGSSIHIGLGLWRSLPSAWWFVELAVIIAACAYYIRQARHSQAFGRRPWLVTAVILALHAFNSPWMSQLTRS
jgi:membrane-bound metal-dependent hydrolase YbcI (DUF457 family)